MPRLAALLLAAVAHSVLADDGLAADPYLEFRPDFARSLPVQIMLTGVVLTLVAVLFIHLMFTAQYHWPLAPVNYVLQLSGVTTLLISLIATIHVVLSTTFAESEEWPYMFNYIAINIPPLDLESSSSPWSIAERATWLVMNASTSGLIQITHIQFLTLLYPSRLEARLIFFLLGPLAIVAAIMQLLPISSSESVRDIAGAVRNVCNATLSLLFTVALFIWGLLVNRKQAWRTDGGTAVFGAAALTLALVSTALNLLYVDKEQEYVWLPSLMWAVVLWQSFLGWWWWVGAGSGGGYSTEDDDVEEKLRREAKKDTRRREAQERRRRVWQGVAGAFGSNNSAQDEDGEPVRSVERRVRRRRRRSIEEEDIEVEVDHDEEQEDQDHGESSSPRSDTARTSRTRTTHTRTRTSDSRTHTNTHTNTNTQTNTHSDTRTRTRTGTADDTASVTSSSGTGTSKESYTTLPRALPDFVHRWYAKLRHAHVVAARQQAAERVERMREIRADARVGRAGEPSTGAAWGFGWTGFRRRSPSVGDPEYEMDDYERRPRRTDTTEEPEESSSPSSMWWWGPLRRWRLRDSTVYR